MRSGSRSAARECADPARLLAVVSIGAGLLAAQQGGSGVPNSGEVVARAQVWGGNVRCVAFDGDGSHALSAGALGDLIHWSCGGSRPEPVRRWPGFGSAVVRLALHPQEPWALVVSERQETRQLVRLDLANDDVSEVCAGAIEAIAFSPEGSKWALLRGRAEHRVVEVFECALPDGAELQPILKQKAIAGDHICFAPDGGALYVAASDRTTRWPLDGSTPEQLPRRILAVDAAGTERTAPAYEPRVGGWSVSPDGAVVVTYDDAVRGGIDRKKALLRRTPTEERWRSQRAIVRLVASPRGSVWATDYLGVTQVFGPRADDRALVDAHVGAPSAVVFSLDAKYLVLMGRAGVRVLAERGDVVLERSDVVAVLPGESGSEFLLVTREGIERWHAASGQMVGDAVLFRGGQPRNDGFTSMRNFVPLAFVPMGRGWLCAPGIVDGRNVELCAVSTQGQFSRLDPGPGGAMGSAFFAPAVQDGDPVVFAASEPREPRTARSQSRLSAWSAAGERVAQRMLEHTVLHVRRSPDGRRVLGFMMAPGVDGLTCWLEEWDATSLETVRRLEVESRVAFESFDADRVCRGGAEGIDLLDLTSGDRTPLFSPKGGGGAGVLAISHDRRHLAVRRGVEVLWVRLR